MTSSNYLYPHKDCSHCLRLVTYRNKLRSTQPTWHNAPVPSFGALSSKLLIVGLAPGLSGANRTGRPFTGDGAGELLYPSLIENGLAAGKYESDPKDNLQLINCRITNAVRCLPPENKPIGAEVNECRKYLKAEIEAMPKLKVILSLGRIAHNSTISSFNKKQSDYLFKHNTLHVVGDLTIVDSYHCSRYNINTGRLTKAMFHEVLQNIKMHFFD